MIFIISLLILYQCPFGLLFISTILYKTIKNTKGLCQCPFGLLFISTYEDKLPTNELIKVSMPIRASLHFHIRILPWRCCSHSCVNAHSGFSSFPPFGIWCRVDESSLCQCPFGLLFISTITLTISLKTLVLCQCPFGLLFISTWSY